jgi:hypothetical protein
MWVKSRPQGPEPGLPLRPQERTSSAGPAMSEKCQIRTCADVIGASVAEALRPLALDGEPGNQPKMAATIATERLADGIAAGSTLASGAPVELSVNLNLVPIHVDFLVTISADLATLPSRFTDGAVAGIG